MSVLKVNNLMKIFTLGFWPFKNQSHSERLNKILDYWQSLKLFCTRKDTHLTVELDEHIVAQFLADLSDRKVLYSHISIDKLTLEDYFLNIAK